MVVTSFPNQDHSLYASAHGATVNQRASNLGGLMGYFHNILRVSWNQGARERAGAASVFGITAWGGMLDPTFGNYDNEFGEFRTADRWPGTLTHALGIRFMREMYNELIGMGADQAQFNQMEMVSGFAIDRSGNNMFGRIEPRAVAIRIDLMEQDIRRRSGVSVGPLTAANFTSALLESRDRARIEALVTAYNELNDEQKSYSFSSPGAPLWGTGNNMHAPVPYDPERDLNPQRIALLQMAADRFGLLLDLP
jgi:hypothetical protein